MSKRKFNEGDFSQNKRRQVKFNAKKHSLDSDEEDDYDETAEELNADDIEGEEEGISRQVEGVRMTAFNMKEEMEEGHFDKEGHFIWNNEKEIRDNWLDNIDWHKVNSDDKYQLDPNEKGLGAESDSESEAEDFDEVGLYKKMLNYMKPKETVNKCLRRLGGDLKLSSVERLKRKKAGTLNSNQDVADMTEIANSILTKTGNMNVYQETFEEITKKIDDRTKPKNSEPVLDMYADDFGDKEKEKMETASVSGKPEQLMWEFKWDQDKDQVEGPYDTSQMLKWSKEGYFKTGVWVRKCGEQSNFYTSNRIDFELYD
ncbi:CD2 antigen cytoplasmic tail-binding protein 2 homolog [Tribolium castaneum]|uniref:CD2 antigen cytoplasmic tail-binding protein 2 homolog-like Protein n=1 Tax=Tribolium castaneum TaxID=7070 RepID=D2A0R0_TRICA|nr:PREDICTED: CD2 antigen cytoplasmic tail-binding protein 2 homolog [Tribolium castaneum]EFA01650.1 CD2 antigen cytoplasmic tail-binding protein 2 homolog-like Protein [Tribolium castaneum]|eukprot:XP_969973.1 PREDICTED: CD2 antigen cytoplasmic tail-binding protein 2 homolog [Tribolium castaneum]